MDILIESCSISKSSNINNSNSDSSNKSTVVVVLVTVVIVIIVVVVMVIVVVLIVESTDYWLIIKFPGEYYWIFILNEKAVRTHQIIIDL